MTHQAVLRVQGLPDSPLDAAAAFYRDWIDCPRNAERDDVVILFPAADHTHRAWRLAAVQELARIAAPARVNALSGGDEAGIAAAIEWLAGAPGVTGQLLQVDGNAAQKV